MVSREPTCAAGREITCSNPRYESLDRSYCGGLSSANCRPSPDQSHNLKLTHYAFAVAVDLVNRATERFTKSKKNCKGAQLKLAATNSKVNSKTNSKAAQHSQE